MKDEVATRRRLLRAFAQMASIPLRHAYGPAECGRKQRQEEIDEAERRETAKEALRER